jgi:O-antigen/teichoic acid export membrane protein
MLGFGVYALAYANFFRGIATFAYSLVLTIMLIKKNKVSLKFQPGYFRSFSSIFAFTFSSRLFETIVYNIDLVLVSRYLGSSSVTVLDLCRRPLKLVAGLANNVTISMLPTLPHLFGSGQTEKIRTTVIRIWIVILWISGFLIGGFILFNFSLIANWVGRKFWIGNTNNIIMCVSFFLLSIGYNLSNVTYSMGDIRNNSIISVVKGIVYLVFLFIMAKISGMGGILFAFISPCIIMLLYYPGKVIREAALSGQNKREIFRETLFVVFILAACAIISSFLHIRLSWLELFFCGILYSIIYIVALLAASQLFKDELNKIVLLIQLKLVGLKNKNL